MIVFRQAMAGDEGNDIRGLIELAVAEGCRLQQGFEIGGLAGVIVDAAPVHHHGRGALLRTGFQRAEKAILEGDIGQVAAFRRGSGAGGRGLVAPAGDRSAIAGAEDREARSLTGQTLDFVAQFHQAS